jgi:hypothetical protein
MSVSADLGKGYPAHHSVVAQHMSWGSLFSMLSKIATLSASLFATGALLSCSGARMETPAPTASRSGFQQVNLVADVGGFLPSIDLDIRAHFGAFSNDILIGNFGDGVINAFDPATGNLLGQLEDPAGNVIINPGLWALLFRGDRVGGENTLYFTAGASGESHGLFGTISPSN